MHNNNYDNKFYYEINVNLSCFIERRPSQEPQNTTQATQLSKQ